MIFLLILYYSKAKISKRIEWKKETAVYLYIIKVSKA